MRNLLLTTMHACFVIADDYCPKLPNRVGTPLSVVFGAIGEKCENLALSA